MEALRQKLLAAARADMPSASVPYAFEKRVMAQIASLSKMDPWSFWAKALWKAAAPCIGVSIALLVWTVWLTPQPSADDLLTVELQSAVYAPLELADVSW